MVKAGNVQVKEDVISMDCIPDGRAEEMFTLVLDRNTLEVIKNTHGKFDAYVAHARWTIKKYIEDGEEIPKSFTSMWY